jgi:hypothetical protein
MGALGDIGADVHRPAVGRARSVGAP